MGPNAPRQQELAPLGTMSMGHWFLKGLSLKFNGSRKHCKLQNEAFSESGVFIRLLPHRVPLDKG